jgi:hypothetical protein
MERLGDGDQIDRPRGELAVFGWGWVPVDIRQSRGVGDLRVGGIGSSGAREPRGQFIGGLSAPAGEVPSPIPFRAQARDPIEKLARIGRPKAGISLRPGGKVVGGFQIRVSMHFLSKMDWAKSAWRFFLTWRAEEIGIDSISKTREKAFSMKGVLFVAVLLASLAPIYSADSVGGGATNAVSSLFEKQMLSVLPPVDGSVGEDFEVSTTSEFSPSQGP